MIEFINICGIIVFCYFIFYCFAQTILLIASFPDIMRRFDEIRYGNIHELINTGYCIPLTVIIPAYNMGEIMMQSIKSILNSNYKQVNIIIVNDGSTDDTMERLKKQFSLYQVPLVIKEKIKTSKLRGLYESETYPQISVIDKEHGPGNNGSDCLNAGINACRTPVYLSIDADTIIENDALTRIMFAFIARAHCIIVGGAVYVINGNETRDGKFLKAPTLPKSWVASQQVCEYFRSFLFGRAGWTPFGGSLCYAGAFTLFEAEIVRQIGGYDTKNFAYDAEIVLHLHEYMREKKSPYSVEFTPAAFSWTEVPDTLKKFWKQRNFWQRGMLKGFWMHRRIFLNLRYGVVGIFTYPFFVLFEIFAPIVELCSYFLIALSTYAGIFHMDVFLLFMFVATGYIAFLTIATMFLNMLTFNKYSRWTDIAKIFFYSVTEIFFFRQYLSLCTSFATLQFIYNRAKGNSDSL